MAEALLKPYLKWAGGKRQLIPAISAYLPGAAENRVYYEPFVGAGAVLFHARPARAVVNDFNEQLMTAYEAVRDCVEELIALLEEHAANNAASGESYYYLVRGQDRDTARFASLSRVEKAARLIFLNKTCYNGLYRVNGRGFFNVPYGRYKNPAVCEADVLRAVSRYLRENEVTLLHGDFAPAVKDADENAFVYFDPPYHSPGNANFTGYQAGGFGEREQIRLRDTFADLARRGARCLLSNSDTPFIRDLYKDFAADIVPAKRSINADSAGRGSVNEVLIRSW